MNKIYGSLVGAATLAIFGSVVVFGSASVAQTSGAEAVEKRIQLMRTMGKSFGPIITVAKGQSTDLAAAAAAAKTMQESMQISSTLFLEGTAKGDVPGSRSRPEVWTNAEEFKTASEKLIKASGDVAAAAQSGDLDKFKSLIQPLGAACGGCHLGKGGEGGKFRFPKEG